MDPMVKITEDIFIDLDVLLMVMQVWAKWVKRLRVKCGLFHNNNSSCIHTGFH